MHPEQLPVHHSAQASLHSVLRPTVHFFFWQMHAEQSSTLIVRFQSQNISAREPQHCSYSYPACLRQRDDTVLPVSATSCFDPQPLGITAFAS
jgi:hypothetical protein